MHYRIILYINQVSYCMLVQIHTTQSVLFLSYLSSFVFVYNDIDCIGNNFLYSFTLYIIAAIHEQSLPHRLLVIRSLEAEEVLVVYEILLLYTYVWIYFLQQSYSYIGYVSPLLIALNTFRTPRLNAEFLLSFCITRICFKPEWVLVNAPRSVTPPTQYGLHLMAMSLSSTYLQVLSGQVFLF